MKEREIFCKVFGNVQGVFFRKFAKDIANEFGISGFAENKEDGTVEVVVQGTEENLRKFLEKISVGPEEAEVDNLEVSWGPIEFPIKGFESK